MKQDSSRLSGERLNFIIAVSAILISAASFYATYLQADAAEKQVRAMTLPLIQFEHGNYDLNADSPAINFTLKNAGVGPAVIRSVTLNHNSQSHSSVREFLLACCEEIYRDYLKESRQLENVTISQGAIINSTLLNSILPGQSELTFFKLFKSDLSTPLWEALNRERWNLQFSTCFCSLLEDCYTSDQSGVITEVKNCPIVNNGSAHRKG